MNAGHWSAYYGDHSVEHLLSPPTFMRWYLCLCVVSAIVYLFVHIPFSIICLQLHSCAGICICLFVFRNESMVEMFYRNFIDFYPPQMEIQNVQQILN